MWWRTDRIPDGECTRCGGLHPVCGPAGLFATRGRGVGVRRSVRLMILVWPSSPLSGRRVVVVMSMHPRPWPDVPEETAVLARRVMRHGNLAMRIRDELGPVYDDERFAAAFGVRGRPGISPGQLMVATVLQFSEDLTDRQAAEAVRDRISWKYALGLPLRDTGFDASVLSEFRGRLLAGGLERLALDALLQRLAGLGLLGGGRARTDSTHVLASIRTLNRLELAGETLRAALEALAAAAPDWLAGALDPSWQEAYGARVEHPAARLQDRAHRADGPLRHRRLPAAGPGPRPRRPGLGPAAARGAGAAPGLDPAVLPRVRRRAAAGAPPRGRPRRRRAAAGRAAPAVALRHRRPLRRQARPRLERVQGPLHRDLRPRPRPRRRRPRRAAQPHHRRRHHRRDRAGRRDDRRGPPASWPAGGLAPAEHLVDAGYASAALVARAARGHGIALVCPMLLDHSRQARAGAGYARADFALDFDARTATCPQQVTTAAWSDCTQRGTPVTVVRWPAAACGPCPAHDQCTRGKRRTLTIPTREAHQALAAARAEQATDQWKARYRARAGIEGTMHQTTHAAGIRRARYRGRPKTALEHNLAAAAINMIRLDAYWTGHPLDRTRTSHLARIDFTPPRRRISQQGRYGGETGPILVHSPRERCKPPRGVQTCPPGGLDSPRTGANPPVAGAGNTDHPDDTAATQTTRLHRGAIPTRPPSHGQSTNGPRTTTVRGPLVCGSIRRSGRSPRPARPATAVGRTARRRRRRVRALAPRTLRDPRGSR